MYQLVKDTISHTEYGTDKIRQYNEMLCILNGVSWEVGKEHFYSDLRGVAPGAGSWAEHPTPIEFQVKQLRACLLEAWGSTYKDLHGLMEEYEHSGIMNLWNVCVEEDIFIDTFIFQNSKMSVDQVRDLFMSLDSIGEVYIDDWGLTYTVDEYIRDMVGSNKEDFPLWGPHPSTSDAKLRHLRVWFLPKGLPKQPMYAGLFDNCVDDPPYYLSRISDVWYRHDGSLGMGEATLYSETDRDEIEVITKYCKIIEGGE